jgi:hypothetical protein
MFEITVKIQAKLFTLVCFEDIKCKTGRSQSPIEITRRLTTRVKGMEPLIFQHYEDEYNETAIDEQGLPKKTFHPTVRNTHGRTQNSF